MPSQAALVAAVERPSRAPRPPPIRRRRFQFFDTGVVVRSDLPEMLSLLDGMFASFAVAEQGPDGPPDDAGGVVCSVLERGARAEIRIDGRRYRVVRRDAAGLGYVVLLKAALRRIRSHLLLHAGALERRGRGVLLAGGSGAGKSTLAVELVRRGFRLLSDDVAAIRLRDGVVEPFPRSLGLVPPGGPRGEKSGVPPGGPKENGPSRSRGLDGLDPAPPATRFAMPLIGGGEKLLIRPEALGGSPIGRACPVKLLVLLPNGSELGVAGEFLHVVFSELPAGLRDAIEALHGVSGVAAVPNRLFPELRLRSAGVGRALRRVDAACARFGVAILETSRGDTRAVHTSATPELIPLPESEAARALLRRLHVAQDSALIQGRFGGSGGRLLLHLARLVAGMRCATLTVGRLAERADRVCQAFDEIERADNGVDP